MPSLAFRPTPTPPAVVVRGPSGVEARLYYGPEPDEYDAVPAELDGDADVLAVGHSCRF